MSAAHTPTLKACGHCGTDDKRGVMRDPYNRIVLAAENGRGVRLTPQECRDMALDDAISTRAGVLWDRHRGLGQMEDGFLND